MQLCGPEICQFGKHHVHYRPGLCNLTKLDDGPGEIRIRVGAAMSLQA
jgi:hypothetical protein